jgi:fructose-1,6-bisphosphatase/inositol monophosphatase family enzyme
MRSDTNEKVASIMRLAAAEAILPRFRKLQTGDIEEKSPGEVVSIADREAERIIAPRLASLVPGSRVVGEEAAAETPAVLKGLDQGDVWLVDPLDGTANFVAGAPEFCVMVALLTRGRAVASWILHPLSGQLAIASLGDGAYIDGVRVRTTISPLVPIACCGSVLTRFLPEPLKARIVEHSSRFAAILPGAKCAGIDYPALVGGAQQFLLFWRLLPWDHAPGTLLVTEAGGHVARLNGSPYYPADQEPGILVAPNRATWEMVRPALLGSM